MQVLVNRPEAEEILVDLDTLIELSIVPADFPLPQDPELRSEKCRRVEENKKNAAEYLKKLEKKVKEDETGPLEGTGLNSSCSPPIFCMFLISTQDFEVKENLLELWKAL